MDKRHPINEYVDRAGITLRQFALDLGVTPSMIGHIVHNRRPCPPGLAAKIERVHGLPAEKLRPDVFNGLTSKPRQR